MPHRSCETAGAANTRLVPFSAPNGGGIVQAMSAKTLGEIQASIERLDLADQVRLLEYLTPKIASAVLAPSSGVDPRDRDAAWRRFRAVGERLAATSLPGAPSLTDSVSRMRR